MKRVFDLFVCLFFLACLLPLICLIAAAIRRSSTGPVLFRQIRLGRGNNPFVCLKFRTMVVLTGEDPLLQLNQRTGRLDKTPDDARVTPVGRFLRRTSLDELPQLFNVLKGEMSMVGPRPLVPFMLAGYPAFARRRGTVPPGITGLWQIRARHLNTSALDMLSHDLEYLDRQTLWLDIRILLATLPAVLHGRGAY